MDLSCELQEVQGSVLSVTGGEMFDLVIYISKGLSIVFYR